jgi:DNA-binding IclR family transcriptional regulator
MPTGSRHQRDGHEETSLERGLRVLLAIFDRESVRVDALVEQLGMPVSTVYRYLRPLRELGLVEEVDGHYRPGSRLSSSGREVSNFELAQLSKPLLAGLASETTETALLTVRVGVSALCVEQVVSPHHIRMAFEIGQVLPLAAGAGSRILLAYAPAEVIDTVLDGPLATFTSSTPDASKLRRQLENIRAAGFATSRGEFIDDAFAVAAPVFHRGSMIAGLTLAGPANRCSHRWQVMARPALIQAAQTLSDLLG